MAKERTLSRVRRSQLNEYGAPVPEFALATALELHQRLRGIRFEIDELLVNRVRCDPFLVAIYNEVEYYAWAAQ